MKRRGGLIGLFGAALPAWAAMPPGAGRWEGQALVQGEPMPLVIDLDRNSVAWTGVVTLPGRRIKGAPLADLQVDARGARFTLASAFLAPPDPPPAMTLRWRGRDVAVGELRINGLVAPVTLRRHGDAQLEPPQRTPIDEALVGTWVGRYELGGTPREVTLVLGRDAAGRGSASMTIVGRRRTELPFEHVVASRSYLSLTGNGFDIAVEGAWRGDAIDATMEQGPYKAQLRLRREGAK